MNSSYGIMIALFLLWAVINGIIAYNKRRSFLLCFGLSFFITPLFATVVALSLNKRFVHANIKTCLLTDNYLDTESFEYNGNLYDRNKYIEKECACLLEHDAKNLSEDYIKLRDEKESMGLSELEAARFEAYKRAILKHPGLKNSGIYRAIEREYNSKEE